MFTDAIRAAEDEHEIYSLVTEYVEGVRFSNPLSILPPSVIELPLNGAADVKLRVAMLVIELDTASRQLDDRACGTIKEALHIFAAAATRLDLLAMPPGTSVSEAFREAA